MAIKPSHQGNKLTQCSQNIVVRNTVVAFGVGMTIGSVPPKYVLFLTFVLVLVFFKKMHFSSICQMTYHMTSPSHDVIIFSHNEI